MVIKCAWYQYMYLDTAFTNAILLMVQINFNLNLQNKYFIFREFLI